jgi:hypothetical protein
MKPKPPQKSPHVLVVSSDTDWANSVLLQLSQQMDGTPFRTISRTENLYPSESVTLHTEALVVDCRGLNGELDRTLSALTSCQVILVAPHELFVAQFERHLTRGVTIQSCAAAEEIVPLFETAAAWYSEIVGVP